MAPAANGITGKQGTLFSETPDSYAGLTEGDKLSEIRLPSEKDGSTPPLLCGGEEVANKGPKSATSTDVASSSSRSSSASESDVDTDSDTDSERGAGENGVATDGGKSRGGGEEGGGSVADLALTALVPEATILIFDWDDTLLPSTWIREQGLRLDAESIPSEEQQAQLDEVAKGVMQTLRTAELHGQVVLVTNAESGWVELSCRKFMPTLCPIVDRTRIVSARTTYENQGIASPFEWKYLAFEHEVQRFYEHQPPGRRKNIISFGDSAHEREALIRVTQRIPNCCTKSLKFVERPEPEQLLKEHELMSGCIRRVSRHEGDLDLCVSCS